MCRACWEDFGLQVVVALARSCEFPDDMRNPLTLPTIAVEGGIAIAPGLNPEGFAISLRCATAENSINETGRFPDGWPPAADGPLDGWCPPASLGAATPADVDAAVAVLKGWLRGIDAPPYGPDVAAWRDQLPGPGEAAPQEWREVSIEAIWAAWLLVSRLAGPVPKVMLARQLVCSDIPPCPEDLDLAFQRRAALAWHDEAGFPPILAAYGVTMRPVVAHWVAFKREIPPDLLAALRERAAEQGEAGCLAAFVP